MSLVIIAIDVASGDFGLKSAIPACVSVLVKKKDLFLKLVGQEEAIKAELAKFSVDSSRFEIVNATEVVKMTDKPSFALRNKKDSSMRVAINLVRDGKAMAAVSAGNTGALMSTAHFVLRTIEGVDRPAIVALFPTENGKNSVRVLDLGANTSATPQMLEQFALMGSILAKKASSIANPRVGLLNIGSEDIKGNETVKEAAVLFEKNEKINYVGFVEGDKMFSDVADVVVCDGFSGNVMLKGIEGTFKFVRKILKQAFLQNWFTKILALCFKPYLKKSFSVCDPRKYNGAIFIGLNGIVVKSHGNADAVSFENAILEAYSEAKGDLSSEIKKAIELSLEK